MLNDVNLYTRLLVDGMAISTAVCGLSAWNRRLEQHSIPWVSLKVDPHRYHLC